LITIVRAAFSIGSLQALAHRTWLSLSLSPDTRCHGVLRPLWMTVVGIAWFVAVLLIQRMRHFRIMYHLPCPPPRDLE
jgi:hypothetical protein